MQRYSKAERALIWLCACTDLEPRQRIRLLRAAKAPEDLFEHFESYLKRLSFEEGEIPTGQGKSTREEQLSALLREAEEKNYFAVTAVSRDYPESLKVAAPPLVLFGTGRRELLSERKFCIVGSRTTPPWAVRFGEDIAGRLAKRFTIVTGLAEGGDLSAVRGALPSGKLICVLPCGLDECYPAAHASIKAEIAKKGLILSEYPFKEKTRKYSFPVRNRILAGLSEGVLVLSAAEKSGALITADHALEFGRDVFAVPYNPGILQGVGCNELLKKGAYVCTSARDIYDCYGFLPEREEQREALSEEEETLYRLLKTEGQLHAAVLAERAGIPAYRAAAILASLELKGLIAKAGGNRYDCVK